MRTKFWIFLLSCSCFAASCNDGTEEATTTAKTIEVTVGSGPRIDINSQTRTALGDDGETITWKSTDKIALWAENSQSAMQISAQPFSLWHYNEAYNTAAFSAIVSEMPTDTYKYYAVSPVPTSVAGTAASYSIPATQDGTFHGEYDIMVATPVTAGALQQGDNTDAINFSFSHKVHILKIRIPSNDLGEEITAIRLDFPVAVTGTLTVDATDPTAAPVVTNGSTSLLLEFATPKKVGDVVYAMIAPVSLTAEQSFTITAYSEIGETNAIAIAGKNFTAGHYTPIAYNVPTAGIIYTRLTFTLPSDKGTSTLGETVTGVTLTAPSGSTFDNGSNVRTFTPNANGSYTIVLKPTVWTSDNLSGKNITIAYESENAIVSSSITMPNITLNASNPISLSVPYLYEENFSGITKSQNRDESTLMLSDYGLPNWGASRYRLGPGRAAIFIYVGSSAGLDIKPGRLDSPALTGLKSSATVSIKVSYSIGGTQIGGTLSSKWVSVCKFGTETTEGAISGGSEISRIVETFTPTYNGNLTDDLPQSKTYSKITGITHATRLAWRSDYTKESGNNWATITAKDLFIYIDNIKVSISK